MMVCLFLAIVLVVSNRVEILAQEDSNLTIEEIFPEEEVKKLEESARNSLIYYDKDENDELQLNLSRSTGTYPTRKGVILVTEDKYKDIIPTGHAAIVYSSGYVVESLADGVVMGKNNWNITRETCYGVTVIGTTVAADGVVADWCYNQIGKPYNYNYLNVSTRETFYCSQLVWAGFKDVCGIDLNTIAFLGAVHPIELVDSSNTGTIYIK